MVTIFSILIGFSGIIAAVGLVNNLSLSVLQRTRELGLLRALGFSVQQLRRMILSESAQLTAHRGRRSGSCSAASTAGRAPSRCSAAINGSPGFVFPAVPWVILAVVVVGGAALTAIASWAPDAARDARVADHGAVGRVAAMARPSTAAPIVARCGSTCSAAGPSSTTARPSR